MKLIRQHILFLVIFLIYGVLVAQKPRVQNLVTHDDRVLHFGFNIGINTMDFGITNSNYRNPSDSSTLNSSGGSIFYADVYKLQPGFHVSIVSNLRLHEYLDLRFLPGIAFGQRRIYFIDDIGGPVRDVYGNDISEQKLNSSFIDFPLLLKYKAKRINNFRPYLVTGGNIRLDLAAKKDYDDEKKIYLRLKPFDVYYEIGFGFDSFLQYFKLSTEIKYSVGLRNVLVNDKDVIKPEFVNAINKMYSRLVMLSFYFE